MIERRHFFMTLKFFVFIYLLDVSVLDVDVKIIIYPFVETSRTV